jgi:hypothetical protein
MSRDTVKARNINPKSRNVQNDCDFNSFDEIDVQLDFTFSNP